MTEEPGTLEETETGTATETQQEPVIQTVKITATGDCTLGATQTHGYAGSFHEYYEVLQVERSRIGLTLAIRN